MTYGAYTDKKVPVRPLCSFMRALRNEGDGVDARQPETDKLAAGGNSGRRLRRRGESEYVVKIENSITFFLDDHAMTTRRGKCVQRYGIYGTEVGRIVCAPEQSIILQNLAEFPKECSAPQSIVKEDLPHFFFLQAKMTAR